MLCINNSRLTIPYSYFRKEDCELVGSVIIQHIIRLRLKLGYFLDSAINRGLNKSKIPFLKKKTETRTAILSSKILDGNLDLDSYRFHDGDG